VSCSDLVLAAIAIGSNLGDRRQHIEQAFSALEIDLAESRRSRIIETRPSSVGEEHGPFLNAAIVGRTALSARVLLERLLEIEEEQGRARPYPLAPRTLDLDLILYGSAEIREHDLIVPHPRFRERAFVLQPLAEIAPELVDPVTQLTVAQLLDRFGKLDNR
jgi:2-amino-4-hydroxy-6-hydroxymethyldihydropteridine diphosphokinase